MLIACIDIGVNEVSLLLADAEQDRDAEILALTYCPIYRNSKLNSPSLFEIANSIKRAVEVVECITGYGIKRAFVSVSSIYTQSFDLTSSILLKTNYVQPKDIQALVVEMQRTIATQRIWAIQHVLSHYFMIDDVERSDSAMFRCAKVKLTVSAHVVGGPAGLLADAATACNLANLKVYDAIANHIAIFHYANMHGKGYGNSFTVDIGKYFTTAIFHDSCAISYSKTYFTGSEKFFNMFYREFLYESPIYNQEITESTLTEMNVGIKKKIYNVKRRRFIPSNNLFCYSEKQIMHKFLLVEFYNFFYKIFKAIPVETLKDRELNKIVLIGEFFKFPGVEYIAERAFRNLNKKLKFKFFFPSLPMASLAHFNQFSALIGNLISAIKHRSIRCNFFTRIMYTLQLWILDLV